MWIGNTIIASILLALAIAGAWRWYDSHVKSQSKEMETPFREPPDLYFRFRRALRRLARGRPAARFCGLSGGSELRSNGGITAPRTAAVMLLSSWRPTTFETISARQEAWDAISGGSTHDKSTSGGV